MTKKLTQEDFLKQMYHVHGEKIDFSEAVYINDCTKVKCICNKCGNVWEATPNNLKGTKNRKPKGCPKCAHRSTKYTLEEFIALAMEKWGDKYDLSLIKEYKGRTQKIPIICKKHGYFEIIAGNFLSGHGCKLCGIENNPNGIPKSFVQMVKDAKRIHGNKYSYNESTYKNARTKMSIVCPEHGEFWQTPHKHINGKHGCPKCNESKLEVEIENGLKYNKIKHIICYSPEWLGLQHLDFYLPDYNIAIECQGNQHYESRDFFGGETEFNKVLERDTRKARLCKENGVKLLYFTHYSKIKEEDNIYKNKDKLLEEILHNAKSI
jgi:Zn finger protein HypA/HybF involved in hydrogenase expression